MEEISCEVPWVSALDLGHYSLKQALSKLDMSLESIRVMREECLSIISQKSYREKF